MVKKFVVYRSELQEVGSFLPDRDAYDRVVKYEDYELMVADRDYWYEKCLNAGVLDRGDMAHDRAAENAPLTFINRPEGIQVRGICSTKRLAKDERK